VSFGKREREREREKTKRARERETRDERDARKDTFSL